jgi:serine/threonine protein kinase
MLDNETRHTAGQFANVVSGIVSQRNYKKIVDLHGRVRNTLKKCNHVQLPKPGDHIIIKRATFAMYLENGNTNNNTNNNNNNTNNKRMSRSEQWMLFVKDCERECFMHRMMDKNPSTSKYVPRFYFAGLEGETFVAVMQHVPGKSLDDIFNQKNSAGKYTRLTKEEYKLIREAVNVLHRAGFRHGDLHSGNIIFDKRTGQVYFIDFTTSKLTNNTYDGGMHHKNDNMSIKDLMSYVRA